MRIATNQVLASGGSPPVVTSLGTATGTEVGGTSVQINGTSFTWVSGAAGVRFGGVNAASYVVNSDILITAVTPAITRALSSTAADNAVSVAVTNPKGTGTLAAAYTYTSELKRIAGLLYNNEYRAYDPAITVATGVSNWPDYNGGGAMTQSTGSKQPTLSATGYNGGPCIQGDGVDDVLQAILANTIAGGSRPYLMIVMQRGTTTKIRAVLGASGSNTYLTIGRNGLAQFGGARRPNGADVNVTTAVALDTNRHLEELGFTAGGTNSYVLDGAGTNSADAAATTTTIDRISVGGYLAAGLCDDAKVVAVLALNGDPTAQNLTDLRAAFKAATWIGYSGNSLGLP